MMSYTLLRLPSLSVSDLPLAKLLVVRASVLAARTKYVHDFRDETGKHGLRRRHLQLSQSHSQMINHNVRNAVIT